ncbi:MAG: primosomal protein N' [Candidatus Aminicenantes bacterium RBG_16_63_16]|nr:MAG: primosomal protein N' [Candidatus Aminicenantes bacterium RBG_16_63_16]
MIRYAEIALPLPLDKTFTYSVPPEFKDRIRPGMRALVPFAGRTLTGIVVGIKKRRPGGGLKLKAVTALPDESPTFPPALLAFTRELGREYLFPWGEVLQAAVPPSLVPQSRACYSITEKGRAALENSLLADEEREVAACLAVRPHTVRFLARRCRAAGLASVLERMRRQELIVSKQELRQVKRRAGSDSARRARQLELDFSLDENTHEAASLVGRAMASGGFSRFLLFGPEDRRRSVYFELIRRALAAGGRVLFIIPEISLTPALIEAVDKWLGEAAAVIHGGLPEARREREWRRIREGRAQVVVGSRLALFAPADNLKLIICDEEQDESYFQQEGLFYDVRDAARLRAAGEGAVLVFGSSAPLVETYYRARKAGYLVDLGGEPGRSGAAILAHDPGRGLISSGLAQAIAARLGRREPVILFFNRRGYASSLICPACGFLPRCSRCSLPLSYHRREGKFVCHYCRFSMPAYAVCPKCRGRLVVRKAVGVEAAAEELRKRFPGRRVEIFATDEAGRKEERERLKLDFEAGRVDVLVGTQFLAHQAGFPRASLVGILHPEFGLRLADFRSAQRTFLAVLRDLRFLSAARGAEAIVQTSAPDHFSIREAVRGDYRAFYEQEITFRRLMSYPPFSAMAEVNFMGAELRRVAAAARALSGRAGDAGSGVSLFGPSLAPAARVRGLHRVQLVLKAPRRERLYRFLREALKGVSVRKSVVISS